MNKLKNKSDGLINFVEYKKPIFKILYAAIIALLAIAVLTALIPVLWLFMAGFKDANEVFSAPFTFFPSSFDLGKIVQVWTTLNFGQYFVNTLIIVAGSVVCAVFFNGILAYVVSVVKPKGYKVIYYLVLASYLIPAMTALGPLVANISSLKLSGYGLYIPLCLLYGANAYYFLIFKTYFDTIPRTLFEAVQIDGANKFQMFFKVALPLSKPIIGVISIFAMTAAWADFLVPYIILTKDSMATVIIKIYTLQSSMSSIQDFGIDKYLMAVSISILPQIFMFAIFQKQIMGTALSSGIKG